MHFLIMDFRPMEAHVHFLIMDFRAIETKSIFSLAARPRPKIGQINVARMDGVWMLSRPSDLP